MQIETEIKVDFNKEKAGQDLTKRARKALFEIMTAVETHSKRLAPVKTGLLRASIHTEPTRPANKIVTRSEVKYSVFQEFGTMKMRASPFLRPGKDIALKVDLPRIMKKNKFR